MQWLNLRERGRMQLRQLTIERFRGIEYLDWTVDTQFVLLVGPGDSGKSTILDAIGWVLRPSFSLMANDADFYNGDTDSDIVITAVVCDRRSPPLGRKVWVERLDVLQLIYDVLPKFEIIHPGPANHAGGVSAVLRADVSQQRILQTAATDAAGQPMQTIGAVPNWCATHWGDCVLSITSSSDLARSEPRFVRAPC